MDLSHMTPAERGVIRDVLQVITQGKDISTIPHQRLVTFGQRLSGESLALDFIRAVCCCDAVLDGLLTQKTMMLLNSSGIAKMSTEQAKAALDAMVEESRRGTQATW